MTILLVGCGSSANSSSATSPRPATRDQCSKVDPFAGGRIPFDGGYQWYCSGPTSVISGKTYSGLLTCGSGGLDERKLWNYWISDPRVKLVEAAFPVGTNQLNFSLRNSTSKKQTFDYWVSCKKSTG